TGAARMCRASENERRGAALARRPHQHGASLADPSRRRRASQGLDDGNLAALELAPEIESIGAQEEQAEPGLEGESDEAEGDLGGEDHQEPGLVAAQAAMIDLHPAGLAAAKARGMAQQSQADDGIGQ